MSLKGNKGEWSELYVLITLLAEGKLYQSDLNLNKDENNVYDVIKAYKDESDYSLEFNRQDEISIYKITQNEKSFISSFKISDLAGISKDLYSGIISGQGKTFPIVSINSFINQASIQKLKADAKVKADIILRIYDHRLAKETDLGFSIKSLIGGRSTLFNTGNGNNFIYEMNGLLTESLSSFNIRTYSPTQSISKITYRLKELTRLGVNISFKEIQSNQLWRNLKMIDGDLPDILAWALYYRWLERESSFKEVSKILEERDPLNFYGNKPNEQKLYKYKLERFLTEAAMGMTSETPWLGEYNSFGGVIVAKEDGNVVCFHIYDFNLFREYLIENTIFEQPSTGEDANTPGTFKEGGKKYRYGLLYEEYGQLLYKINLQVRFK